MALDARLPQDGRLVVGTPCPLQPPVWGCIVDDVWVLATDGSEAFVQDSRGWAEAVAEPLGARQHR
eukprot:9296189-Lingulodinium_polyedra.AAC.1